MNNLKQKIEDLTSQSKYEAAAQTVSKAFNLKLSSKGSEYKKYFASDTQQRYVFKMRLQRGKKSYTFSFGQSIIKGAEEPTMYDVLTCLQKYDVGTFEDFCSEFGYDEDSRTAEKTYKAVCKEFEAIERLFTNEELEVLSLIS